MSWLSDPRVFNVVIILMFIGAGIRWGLAGNTPQSVYWFAAAILNIAVTMMEGK